MKFADLHHYFDWCSLIEKRWQQSVQANAKTKDVNEKLERWHAANPDPVVINLAQRRLERARRQATTRQRTGEIRA
jgi:hypothetical protein